MKSDGERQQSHAFRVPCRSRRRRNKQMNVSKGYMEEVKEDGCNNVQNERCMLLGDSRIGECLHWFGGNAQLFVCCETAFIDDEQKVTKTWCKVLNCFF